MGGLGVAIWYILSSIGIFSSLGMLKPEKSDKPPSDDLTVTPYEVEPGFKTMWNRPASFFFSYFFSKSSGNPVVDVFSGKTPLEKWSMYIVVSLRSYGSWDRIPQGIGWCKKCFSCKIGFTLAKVSFFVNLTDYFWKNLFRISFLRDDRWRKTEWNSLLWE
jgi:hypothetical protein